MAREEDPDHPILPRAFEWEIIGLNVQRAPEDGTEPYLDLTPARNSERRRFRFWSPRDLSIEKGGPHTSTFPRSRTAMASSRARLRGAFRDGRRVAPGRPRRHGGAPGGAGGPATWACYGR